MNNPRLLLAAFTILLFFPINFYGQPKRGWPACTEATLAAFKPLPKLEYDCPDGVADYSDEMLKLPARLAAISKLESSLRLFVNPAWWSADVDSLNSCEQLLRLSTSALHQAGLTNSRNELSNLLMAASRAG